MTNASKPLVAPAHVSAIAPYQAGKPIEELAREFGLDPAGIVKLASNENPLGMPKSARAAACWRRPSRWRAIRTNGFDLKSALATRYGVPMNWITLGNGSNDILEIVALALLEPGTSAVYAQHSFAVYRLATQARGARIVVPAKDYGHDLDAMFDAIADDTRVVFIANPNNPTGTFVPGEQVAAFLERVQAAHGDRVTVVLDRATTNTWIRNSASTAPRWRAIEPDRLAHLLQGLRPGRPARGLRRVAAGADRSAQPRAPAVQCQHARPGRRHRAGRQRLPGRGLRHQQGGQGPAARPSTRSSCATCPATATSCWCMWATRPASTWNCSSAA